MSWTDHLIFEGDADVDQPVVFKGVSAGGVPVLGGGDGGGGGGGELIGSYNNLLTLGDPLETLDFAFENGVYSLLQLEGVVQIIAGADCYVNFLPANGRVTGTLRFSNLQVTGAWSGEVVSETTSRLRIAIGGGGNYAQVDMKIYPLPDTNFVRSWSMQAMIGGNGGRVSDFYGTFTPMWPDDNTSFNGITVTHANTGSPANLRANLSLYGVK